VNRSRKPRPSLAITDNTGEANVAKDDAFLSRLLVRSLAKPAARHIVSRSTTSVSGFAVGRRTLIFRL
jgi:hypothetical protein